MIRESLKLRVDLEIPIIQHLPVCLTLFTIVSVFLSNFTDYRVIVSETTAQVQIKLQYSIEEQTLYVIVQKIRNLQALSLKEDDSV